MEESDKQQKLVFDADVDVIDFMKLVDEQNALHVDKQQTANSYADSSVSIDCTDVSPFNEGNSHAETDCKNNIYDTSLIATNETVLSNSLESIPNVQPLAINNISTMTRNTTRLFADTARRQNILSVNDAQQRNVIVYNNDSYDMRSSVFNEELKINMFPGYLYINIYNVEEYKSADTNVTDLFVRAEINQLRFDTHDLKEGSVIRINNLMHVPLSTNENVKMTFYLYKKTLTGDIKCSETSYTIDKCLIDKIHNTVVETNIRWTKCPSGDLISKFISIFSQSPPDAATLKIHLCFISEEEFKVIGLPIPMSLYDLGKWTKIRKYFYNNWFAGFCNIRGNISSICTYLWKRRFIKVYGYKIYIFNEYTKNLIGRYDLLDVVDKPDCVEDKGTYMSVRQDSKKIEFIFDNTEKHCMFKDVLNILL